MLSLSIRNIFTDTQDRADYHWQLKINERTLAAGAVYEHQRAQGAVALLQKVVYQLVLKGLVGSADGGEEETLNPEVKSPEAQ